LIGCDRSSRRTIAIEAIVAVFSRDQLDPDFTRIAALIGEPSRAAMLLELLDGRALPAGELARCASISPQTASAHLDKLFRARLIAVEICGRHHYYRLRDARVAHLLESLALIAPPRRLSPRLDSDSEVQFARICYDHLAGKLGVAVSQAMCAVGYMREGDAGYSLTDAGTEWCRGLEIDVAALRAGRRPLTRRCLDWSERRPHLAGALGAALADRFVKLRWIARAGRGRAVRLTERGERALGAQLALRL
jgi:DNA-binding transcriptional ArsR family regulator